MILCGSRAGLRRGWSADVVRRLCAGGAVVQVPVGVTACLLGKVGFGVGGGGGGYAYGWQGKPPAGSYFYGDVHFRQF